MVARDRPAALTLQVRSLDALSQRQLEAGGPWRVHSVFARACNLVAPDGELLGVVEAGAGNAPATLVLDDFIPNAGRGDLTPQPPLLRGEGELRKSVRWTEKVAVGDEAALHGGQLVIGLQVALNLTGAAIWRPVMIFRAVEGEEIGHRLALAAAIGAREAPVGGLASLLSEFGLNPSPPADLVAERARTLLAGLLAAIESARWADVAASAQGLSGLGAGLTPGGDDLLAGFVLGLRARRGGLPAALAEAITGAVVGRTTDLAAARVRHAVAGHPDERTHRVLAELVMDTSGAGLPDAVRALLTYGHSSGADTLVGLLAGVGSGLSARRAPQSPKSWNPEPAPAT